MEDMPVSVGDDNSSDDDGGLERALAACSLNVGELEDDDLLKRKKKEQFLMFSRVLMKYLESKDPQMHARARDVIRECAEKNKKKEPGYESVIPIMETRLRATVGDQYWTRAESYLTHFQQKMQERNKTSAGAGGG